MLKGGRGRCNMARSEKAPPSCNCHIMGVVWVFAGDKVGAVFAQLLVAHICQLVPGLVPKAIT